MSWIKKRTPSAPSPAPAPQVPMYNPNQHSTQENQWYSQQVQGNWYNQQAQQPPPTPQQNYPHQSYLSNAPPVYNQNTSTQPYSQQQPTLYQQHQQPSYYQNDGGYNQQQQTYGNLQYNQQYNQNNAYAVGQHPLQQQQTVPQREGDAWNWGWGDEDNSNVQLKTQSPSDNVTPQASVNVVGDSFTNDESWNWGVEDTKQSANVPKQEESTEEKRIPVASQVPKVVSNADPSKFCTIEQPLLSGKRGKLDTPQWSTESQVSQESSDDIVQTSESDKSHVSHSPLATGQFIEGIATQQVSGQFENKEVLQTLQQELPAQPLMSLPPSGSGDDSKNPYKRTTGLSHMSASRFRSSSVTPPDPRQNFAFQQVNLETLPDNSEQPDSVPSTQPPLKVKPLTQWPDNNEAPINDRNQYLETGHLSELSSNDVTDTFPPPGLRRMVPGQIERSENLSSNTGSFGDEPPPGLSRMVLGQTETVSDSMLGLSSQSDIRTQYDTSGPPEGLHRMIPGESSSPESTLHHIQQGPDDNDSEVEFNGLTQRASEPRSATIGADTPPTDVNTPLVQPSSTSLRGKDLESNNRRESIEGQNRENEISNLTDSVRNLTVGENITDAHTSNNSLAEAPPRRHGGQESSESDRELKASSRGHRENRRSSERAKREKEKERDKTHDSRERYTPESYHEKKYDRRRHKDRRYENDTDYYSDKEKEIRSKSDRDREYERRYGSLRKDKEKDRRRRDPRDYRRGDYYYGGRYDEEYDNEGRSSRPSSRSDSMHESYRERGHEKDHRDRRHRDRERERYRRQPRDPRDMYNPYQALSYDPYNPYYQQYQYYENLRRTNPQAYAEWYRKYYQQSTTQASSYGGEDRASVHSGRSSANDELTKDRYTRQSFYSQTSLHHGGYYAADTSSHSISGPYGLDSSSYTRPFDRTDSSLNFEETGANAHRLTPAKFATAHVKASITSGKLLKILPHYPMDGQNATVEICQLQSYLANDEEYLELNKFPGPLAKGVTHKKTIIEYCENKIRSASYNQNVADVDSYVLMWELLILLIRQNGMVVGTDIAELLLKNRQDVPPRSSSVLSSISSNVGEPNISEASNNPISDNMGSSNSMLKEEEVTNKFREFLLYGSGKEALEYAMKHGLWGHALFLASKLDKRTYANVMMRFANGLTLNDPLQTLYQLLSGKIPAAVTCVSDEKWGDWRPHLAMILSNSSQRPELNCKAITTLGDTLNYRGSLYAAQFCYLLAEVGFGKHDDPETRLVLLGADHRKPFPNFVTNEAIHMTEIYEYACGLNVPNFSIPQFQVYKYLLATRLADRGLLEKSLNYLEKISEVIIANPSSSDQHFVDNICRLADRLKFYDPVGEVGEDESEYGVQLETSRPDHSWLKDLRTIQNDFLTGMISHQSIDNYQDYSQPSLGTETTLQSYNNSTQDAWQPQQPWQPEIQQPQQPVQNIPLMERNDYAEISYQDNQMYWPDQGLQPSNENLNQYSEEGIDQSQSYYDNNAQTEPTSEVEKDTAEANSVPQITMPNQGQNSALYDDEPKEKDGAPQKQPSPVKSKPQNIAQEKTQSTGWFGGIFSKLALKPKNQMKLPDDKNPKIVWDQEKKRWVNVDEDASDPTNEFKPPPKMSEMMPQLAALQPVQTAPENASGIPHSYTPIVGQQSPLVPTNVQSSNMITDNNGNAVKSSSQTNMFKLKKSRNLKNSYIDVFNPGGGGGAKPSLPSNLMGPATQPPQMNFFIPQPVSNSDAPVDFLTPGGIPQLGEQQVQ